MTIDLDKLQAAAELGEVIRLQNEALDHLTAFRKSRPYLLVPNLATLVEENLKENVQVLYKELNNLHKPQAQQRRHLCRICNMAFMAALPGGICDECRAKGSTVQPAAYTASVESAAPSSALEDEMQELAENAAESGEIGEDDMGDESLAGSISDAEAKAPDSDADPEMEPERDTDEVPPDDAPEGEEPEGNPVVEEAEDGEFPRIEPPGDVPSKRKS